MDDDGLAMVAIKIATAANFCKFLFEIMVVAFTAITSGGGTLTNTFELVGTTISGFMFLIAILIASKDSKKSIIITTIYILVFGSIANFIAKLSVFGFVVCMVILILITIFAPWLFFIFLL